MSNYLTNYLNEEQIMANEKAYFTSMSLNRPIKYNDSPQVDLIMNRYKNAIPIEKRDYPNKYLGHTYITVYTKIKQVVIL